MDKDLPTIVKFQNPNPKPRILFRILEEVPVKVYLLQVEKYYGNFDIFYLD